MSQFVRTRVRCEVYPAKVGEFFKVVVVGSTPAIYKSTGCEFEFAFFDGNELMDVSNIASITVSVKPKGSPGSAALMVKTIAAPNINTALELVNWQNGLDQHVVVPFLGSETSIGATDYDLTISGFTNDNIVDPDVFGISNLKVLDAGQSNLVIPPLSGQPAATLDDIKGLLAGYITQELRAGQKLTFVSTDGKVKRIFGVENANPAGAEIQRVDDPEYP